MADGVPTEAASQAVVELSGPILPVDHPTATVYLDESGVIKTDRFFGIGCLRVGCGAELVRHLWRQRQKLECFEEIHWSHFDKAATRTGGAFDLAIAAIDAFFDHDDVSFCCTVADRRDGDLAKSFGTGWKAYEALSIRALDASVWERGGCFRHGGSRGYACACPV